MEERADERRVHRLKGKILARRKKNEEERNRKDEDETKRNTDNKKRKDASGHDCSWVSGVEETGSREE